MAKIKAYFSRLVVAFCLVLFCTCLTGSVTSSQQVLITKDQVGLTIKPTVKQELAKSVLRELGIARQYDMYFDHAVGMVVTSSNNKFKSWLLELFAREAGWKYIQNDYILKLTSDFSEGELKELIGVAKMPVMKKLLQSEAQTYRNTSPQRHKLLFQLWDNYNQGKFPIPKEISP